MSQHHDPVAELSPVKRALLELRETRARLDALERQQSDPIAIIGLGCWFPGSVRDPASYWALLRDGVDAIREVPPERWNIDEYYDASPDTPGKMATRWGGFVDDIDRFDADFFGISPREAVTMDPQQRLLLTVAWEALEHAGQAPDRLQGSATGVFVGLSTNDYAQLEIAHGTTHGIDMYFGTGGAHSIVAGRLSYILGLRGPSIAVDTACSSSLVATHLACQSLRTGECRMALAAGVNAVLLPDLTVALSQGHMMAADGRCKAFDASADGFVRGEGCGVLILKRLSDAVADGDRVLALIRGSAVNQDGRSSGLTAPNGPSQEAVIRAALAMAKLDPATIDYIEAHGTGTSLGDPIEAGALAAVFGATHVARPLRVGSVKTQIGHLESAAGVASLMKVVLALRHGELPATLHFRTLNPHIAATQPPIEVVARRQPWPGGSEPRRAGVSSFGFGGTNAHVVIEEAPPAAAVASEPARTVDVLGLSARTPEALRELAARFADCLADRQQDYADVCYTANTGRAQFDYRLALVGRTSADVSTALRDFSQQRPAAGVVTGYAHISTRPGVVFVFSGEGSEYVGMGRELYRTEPVFRRTLDTVASLFGTRLERPLLEVMFGDSNTGELRARPALARAGLFAFERALSELWCSWGVEPVAVIGDGIGEVAAACAAGVFSVDDAVALVVARESSAGSPLQTLEQAAAAVTYREPRIPFWSDTTGAVAAPADIASARYWTRQSRDPRAFDARVQSVLAGQRVLLEVGPAVSIERFESGNSSDHRVCVSSLRKGGEETTDVMTALAALYASGVDVNWDGVYRGRRRVRAELPTYPFEMNRYWHEAVTPSGAPVDVAGRWSRVVDAAVRQADRGPLDLQLDTYEARWKTLDRVTVEHMIAALRARGAFDRAGDALDAGEVIARCGFVPTYRHLMARWLARLAADGLLVAREDGRFESRQPLRDARLEEAWAQARETNASLPALLEYLERCGRLMMAVLTGQESALSTLFPGGDFRTGDFLYSEWALARYFNGIVRGAVEAVVASLPPRRRLWAIELGAGTGGTTAEVLPALPAERTTYVYTDLSEAFFAPAGRKFSAYPFVRYSKFDIEQPPAAQGYPEHAFDLVIAANAVHATRDLRAALAHARSLLAPGGVLVLYEVTRHLPWFEMSVGLIEGWERFADDLRQQDPLLKPDRWAAVLAESGFTSVQILPASGSSAEVLGHNVILALASELEAVAAPSVSPRLSAISHPATAPVAAAPAASTQNGNGATSAFVADLLSATREDRHDRLIEFVRQHVAQVLRLERGRVVDRRHRLMDLGLDSLMAVELRNRLGRGLNVPVPATVAFDYPTIDAVAGFLDRELAASRDGARHDGSNGDGRSGGDGTNGQSRKRSSPDAIADLSDDEVEAMLLRKLEAM
jgi:acyl transferase domain-containing protein/trans-aconitate methyltransferase/acyl carrier protein